MAGLLQQALTDAPCSSNSVVGSLQSATIIVVYTVKTGIANYS